MNLRSCLVLYCLLFAATLLVGAAQPARAHTAQIEPDGAPTRFAVQFWAHEGKAEPYTASKVKSVSALDATGGPVAVSTALGADGIVRATTAVAPALLLLHFDNGIWSRAAGGKSEERPINENPGATLGTHAPKYAKTVLRWTEAASRPYGQPLELVPLSAAAPRAGQPLRVRVLFEGRPLAGAKVAPDEYARAEVTDADGVASVIVARGRNTVWTNHRVEVHGDPRLTQRSFEVVLRFDAQ